MKFLIRWAANSVAFYLALYLVDSVVAGRFRIGAAWVAVFLAVFLGLLNSLFRPLHRLRDKPFLAVAGTVFTVLMNSLIMQVLVWLKAPLHTNNLIWIVLPAAFLSLLGGANNWLIGFRVKEKPSTTVRDRRTERSPRRQEARTARPKD